MNIIADTVGTTKDRRWWDKPKNSPAMADAITTTLLVLETQQRSRLTQTISHARLYGNTPLLGPGWTQSRWAQMQGAQKDKLSFNASQSALDSITAKIAKNKPKPFFLTSGGNYKIQRKAKSLNRFVEGIFYENKAYEKGEIAFRDAGVWGDGFLFVFEKDDRVCFERVAGSELFIDEVEGFYGRPRQFHRGTNIDRAVLEASWGNAVADAQGASTDYKSPSTADVVTVRESWHLPSGPDAKDGLHVISIAGKVLHSNAWEHDFFPFARLQWSPKLFGYWSQGAMEQVQALQLQLNKQLWFIQRSYQLSGGFRILVEKGSKVVKTHLDNDVGTIIDYVGTPPQYILPPVVPPEAYQEVETLIRRIYEQVGVSMLSAVAQKPAGLDSGKALREYNDIESDRFTTIGHAYERFYLDLAHLAIVTAKDIAEKEGGYPVRIPAARRVIEVDWKQIGLEDDDYVMQCFPISSLPNDPAGRLQTVQEYAQAGYLAPEQARKLLSFPDIEHEDSLDLAMEDRLEQILDGIVDDGEYEPPEPYYDLQLSRKMTLQHILRGESQELEPERLDMLRDFLGQIDSLEEAAQQQAMQEQAKAQMAAQASMAPKGQPTGVPAAPPVSELQPNSPEAAA